VADIPDIPDIKDEYRIILHGAGWARRTDRGRLQLQGKDAAAFLQALVSNDVAGVAPGRGVYATYLTPNGRMLADLDLYRRQDGWMIGLAADRARPIAERLDLLIFSEDVQVTDVTSTTSELVVVGNEAASLLATALSIEGPVLAGLGVLAHADVEGGFVARADDARLPIFNVVVPASRQEEVIGRLETAGIRPVSAALLEALRIDAGRPKFGVDMSEETIPLEAGLLDRGISTSKGCYVGQEIIIRILHRGGGRVAKRLVTLSFEPAAGGPPTPGTTLVDSGKPVGHLTSVAPSLTSSNLIALGIVQRDVAEEQRELTVGDTGVNALVTGFAR
jgi:folate-binding protein YgfZ